MFNGCLPESLSHPVTGQLESNCTLKMFKLQTQSTISWTITTNNGRINRHGMMHCVDINE